MTTTDIDPRTWNNDTVRQLERSSIRSFMEENRCYLKGRVLDFGAGKQPYRDLVDGEYVPYEPGNKIEPPFDAVISNQVVQYLPNPLAQIRQFRTDFLKAGGILVMTGPTNWAEVEGEDLFRFTRNGIAYLATQAGFTNIKVKSRASILLGGFELSLGWGLVAGKA